MNPLERSWDAVVIGSGPNGLAAAIELARHDLDVCVLEAGDQVGGGLRSAELTLPGFLHDECSAIHPLGILSPYFQQLPLEDHGLRWLPFPASVAHPLDQEPAVMLYQSMQETAESIGKDGARWRKLFQPFQACADDLFADLLGPLNLRPRRPVQMARFGLAGLRSAKKVARSKFKFDRARALFAGCAAHSVLPLEKATSAAIGMIFPIAAHQQNWPCAAGGSAAIARALEGYIQELGGYIELEHPVKSLADIPESKVVLFDVAPQSFLAIAQDLLPKRYQKRLSKFRYGPAVFKLDWALSEAIPWEDAEIAKASTVHVGGTLEEIAISERLAWEGKFCDKPFLIVCQQSHVDSSRAPKGQHTGYAYCHVPYASTINYTEAIEGQMERFAPGFKDVILARHMSSPQQIEARNANHVGGTITGGANNLSQIWTRPVARLNPYTTPNPRFFLCSSSTPPGGGVHGMCGYHAAQAALKQIFKQTSPSIER